MSEDFGSYGRFNLRKNRLTYKCGGNGSGGLVEGTQAVADKFSASTTNGGNGQLTYAVALITIDELYYSGAAGLTLTSNYNYYYVNSKNELLMNDLDSLSLTPASYEDERTTRFNILGTSVGRIVVTSSSGTVRPVISLKACVKYASGDGSSSNPYQVTIDSACENSEN